VITLPDIQSIPPWAARLFWSIVTVAAAWVIGHLLNGLLIARISRWAARRRGTWDESIIKTIQPRLPRWSLLVGVWLSLSYWPITGQARELVGHALFALAVVSVTVAAATLSSQLVADYGSRFAPAMAVTTLTRNITWALVGGFGLMAVLNDLGVSITPLVTAFGIGGLAMALALQDPLAQLFAGLTMTLARQVRIGDYVRLDTGIEGEIVDFSWRVTRIRMATGKIVLVPNAKLAQAIVTNYSLPTSEVPVPVDLGVDLSTDLEAVERIATDVGREVIREVARREASPLVRYHTFGNSFVKFTVWLVANDLRDQALVVHEFMKRIDARFRERGIAIRM
jgi:small-conductance mechanosensitive channel